MFIKYHKDTLVIKSITTEKPREEVNYVIVDKPEITTTVLEYINISKDPNTGEIIVRELTAEEKDQLNRQKFESSRRNLLSRLDVETQGFIEAKYPDVKQRSDVLDIQYYKLAILAIDNTITESDLNNEIVVKGNEIVDGASTLADYVASKPAEQQKYYEQLMKATVRGIWVQRVKDKYRTLRNNVINATYESGLPFINFELLRQHNFLPNEIKLYTDFPNL